jgi:hypothetical protein
MVMLSLNTSIKDIGDTDNENSIDRVMLLALSDDQASETLAILRKLDYISLPNSSDNFSFSPKGWEKIDCLQRLQKNTTAFIAMSFSTEDPRLTIAEESIKNAIEQAGYIPMIVKDTEHNQSIPQEIDYEIQNAAFVVTDLTGQNNGAYYEAGLAKGYGKDVIFTCHEDDFEKIHFDTKQINTIKWSEAGAFTEALFKRIKYTVGVYSQIM